MYSQCGHPRTPRRNRYAVFPCHRQRLHGCFKKRVFTGIPILMVSIWVRTYDLLVCLSVLAFLCWRRELKPSHTALPGHVGYNLRAVWSYIFAERRISRSAACDMGLPQRRNVVGCAVSKKLPGTLTHKLAFGQRDGVCRWNGCELKWAEAQSSAEGVESCV
jgi:hypothetical protein